MKNPTNTKFDLEPLGKHHRRDSFSSGNEQLDRYFRSQANQDKKKNIAIPYVAIERETQRVIGYYTLSMTSINLEELPTKDAKKLPRYPLIGVTLIGRLAIDVDYQGRGWGKLLVMDALYRSLEASRQVASFAVMVDAIDDKAAKFYQRFDFQPFPEQPLKLFRTMKNIAQTFQ